MHDAYHRAHAFAARWHEGQLDKAGRPYLLHLEDVAAKLLARTPHATHDEIQAALLHDVLEDTACTETQLQAAFGPRVLAIVAALTKRPGRPYLDGIADLVAAADPSVLRIKLADNLSNSDPARAYPGSETRIAEKYAPARALLERALASTATT